MDTRNKIDSRIQSCQACACHIRVFPGTGAQKHVQAHAGRVGFRGAYVNFHAHLCASMRGELHAPICASCAHACASAQICALKHV